MAFSCSHNAHKISRKASYTLPDRPLTLACRRRAAFCRRCQFSSRLASDSADVATEIASSPAFVVAFILLSLVVLVDEAKRGTMLRAMNTLSAVLGRLFPRVEGNDVRGDGVKSVPRSASLPKVPANRERPLESGSSSPGPLRHQELSAAAQVGVGAGSTLNEFSDDDTNDLVAEVMAQYEEDKDVKAALIFLEEEEEMRKNKSGQVRGKLGKDADMTQAGAENL